MHLNFNYEQLKEILVNFYNIASVRTVIYDEEFCKIVEYPEYNCEFCSKIKENPESRKLCKKNDTNAFKICHDIDNIYIYKCHAGLMEAVAPIKVNNIIIGYIMFGQVLDSESDTSKIFDYASTYINDADMLKSYIDKIQVRNMTQIKSIAKIMEMCTGYLWIKKLISIDNGAVIYKIHDYINKNLQKDISIDSLCQEFDIRRTALYELFKKYYGISIAKYIRKKRIEEAANYIKNTGSKISDAAIHMGFIDTNYFSKVFKAEMGMTPSEYKKTINYV